MSRHAMAYVRMIEVVSDELLDHPHSAELLDRLAEANDALHLAERHKARAAMQLHAALYDARNLGSKKAAEYLETFTRDVSI